MTTLEETDIELRVGADDSHRGIKMGVEGEDFWRVHITPQGSVLTGDGSEDPAGSPGAGITPQDADAITFSDPPTQAELEALLALLVASGLFTVTP